MLKKYKKAQVSQTNELFRIILEKYILCYPHGMLIELTTFGLEVNAYPDLPTGSRTDRILNAGNE